MKAKKHFVYVVAVLILVIAGGVILTRFTKIDIKLKSGSELTFYITNDIHYLSNEINDHGAAFQKYISSGDGKQLNYINEIFDAFKDNIKREKPDFLIISGDLTNNGELKSHQALAEKLKSIEKSGTSVYVIPGNHDIFNPWARGFKDDKQYVADNISDTDFSKIYADFGYNEAISRDEKSLSYLAAPAPKLWLLMLDTNRYKDNISLGSPEADGIITKGTLDWMQTCSDLAKEKGATIITVMHHNILHHSEVIQNGYTLNNSGQVLIFLKENNMNLVLSGHIHVQDISSDQTGTVPLYDIATEALSVYPHQFGVLKYSAKNGSLDYSTSKTDVEGWAKKNKMKDENLLNFSSYSKDYFGKLAYDRSYSRLLNNTDYPVSDIKLMSETMKELNTRYFSGVENLNAQDIVNTEGYKLLTSSEESFSKDYVLSITSDKDTDDNKLHIAIPTQNQ
jgi:3',5'-cyclic AMP phosphodiesterase CpdA